jgi:hypothetical protein
MSNDTKPAEAPKVTTQPDPRPAPTPPDPGTSVKGGGDKTPTGKATKDQN